MRDAKDAAREITASAGIEGLTISAVARRLGVSPPALYRYFEGKDGLVRALYDDLTASLIAEVSKAAGRQDPDDVSAQLHTATRTVITWSLENRGAFELLMGSSYQVAVESEGGIPTALTRELGGLFAEPFVQLWRSGTLDYPRDDEIPSPLREQIATYRDVFRPDLPLGVAYLMFTCWRQIYGLANMAVNGHLAFAFGDFDAVFEDMMARLLKLLGLEPSPNRR